ncbi:MAG TPA: Rcs stress response system protein RcsF [Gemmatimonadales bacterium]|nr:Rcs stress response system protein RcsF [Gemmatimonadales bacterium]
MAAVLVACAQAMNFSPEVRRRAAETPILTAEQLAGRSFAVVGEVSGISCARQAGSTPNMEAAREELKLKAAQMEADAVVAAYCREGGANLLKNCWRYIECRGDAVRWRP